MQSIPLFWFPRAIEGYSFLSQIITRVIITWSRLHLSLSASRSGYFLINFKEELVSSFYEVFVWYRIFIGINILLTQFQDFFSKCICCLSLITNCMSTRWGLRKSIFQFYSKLNSLFTYNNFTENHSQFLLYRIFKNLFFLQDFSKKKYQCFFHLNIIKDACSSSRWSESGLCPEKWDED